MTLHEVQDHRGYPSIGCYYKQDGDGPRRCSLQDGMSDQGYIVFIDGKCAIPVARDMESEHYSIIHEAANKTRLTAGGSNLNVRSKIGKKCTDEEMSSYAEAFDPVALHAPDHLEQVRMMLRVGRTPLVSSNEM